MKNLALNTLDVLQNRKLYQMFYNDIVSPKSKDVIFGVDITFPNYRGPIDTSPVFIGFLVHFSYTTYLAKHIAITVKSPVDDVVAKEYINKCPEVIKLAEDIYQGDINTNLLTLFTKHIYNYDETKVEATMIDILNENCQLIELCDLHMHNPLEFVKDSPLNHLQVLVPNDLQTVGYPRGTALNVKGSRQLTDLVSSHGEPFDVAYIEEASHGYLCNVSMYRTVARLIQLSLDQYFTEHVYPSVINIERLAPILLASFDKLNLKAYLRINPYHKTCFPED